MALEKEGHALLEKSKKGNKYCLGKKHPHTEMVKKKISESCKRNGVGKWMKNRKMTEKNKEALIKVNKGNKYALGYKHTDETKRKKSEIAKSKGFGKWMTGKILENSNNWWGGKSFELYGLEFNKNKKEQIRQRDNYQCQECGYSQKELNYKLHIHHIDYNKQNNQENNLISLCRNCHIQTNFQREDWTNYFNSRKNIIIKQ